MKYKKKYSILIFFLSITGELNIELFMLSIKYFYQVNKKKRYKVIYEKPYLYPTLLARMFGIYNQLVGTLS